MKNFIYLIPKYELLISLECIVRLFNYKIHSKFCRNYIEAICM